MQAERILVLVQQAAAGNAEAFLALVQEFAPDLRLMLAVHLDQPGALVTVEPAVWAAVRGRLGEYIGDLPFASWIQQVAVEPVTAHLLQADRRAIDHQDALSHQIIEQSREALTDGGELQAGEIRNRIAGLPEATRALLLRRYRDRQRPAAIAASLMISEPELATSLSAARAACDWRGVAVAPGPGDRLLPPLIEDWLNGTIDVDSRALLATNLGRDLERARQFVRQVRVHLALSAVLAPFTREDAVAIIRQSGKGAGDSARVVLGDGARPVSAARTPSSEHRRVARMTTSNRHVVPLDIDAPRPSAMPWIIGGGMVLVGIFALVMVSLGGGSTRAVPRQAEPSPTVAVNTGLQPQAPPTASTTPDRPAPGAGGILRLDPGRKNAPPPPPPRIAVAGQITSGRAYSNQPVEVRAELSHSYGVTAVEFWNGNERVASVAKEPFVWTWDRPTSGSASFTARALGPAGVVATSTPVTVTVMTGLGTGSIRREWWNGIGGEQLVQGYTVAGYPDQPHGGTDERNFASPPNTADNYLQRLRGFVVPPTDGEYVFWIAADDEGELWLSEDDTRARLRRIAISPMIPGDGVKFGEWERNPSQRSAPIVLVRGRRYYIEALHKEGGGDDHMEVGWRLPDGALERPIPGAHLSPASEPVPAGPVVVQVPSPAPSAPAASSLVLWNGDSAAGGSGYASTTIAKVAGSGRDGSAGLQMALATEFVNLGWNWFSWFPDNAGSDLRSHQAFSFWMRVEGANRPTAASMHFLSSPKSVQAASATIDLAALVPQFADGQWHEVVIPFERLSAPGFDLAKVWEFNLKFQGKGTLAGTVSLDDLTALPQVHAGAATSTAVIPSAKGAQLVRSIDFVSSGAAYVIADARNGQLVFIDRDWKLANLPERFTAGRLIRTRNDDDIVTANPHLRFTADVPVEVYVAIRTNSTVLPSWMQKWIRTDTVVAALNGVDFRLHSAVFPAGQVVLGGNERAITGATDNYFVFVLPAAVPPPTAAWKAIRAINLGGETVEIDGVRFLGHRQAEAEGATPAGSHQPGPRLSDLPWVRANNANGDVRRNRSWSDKPLSIAGQQYPHGLGLHAGAEVVFDLAGRYSGFTAVVGIDDAANPGEAIFQVWVDGQKAFDSGVLRHGTAKPVAVPLTGRKELRLVADPNGGNDWDHADWGNAQLLVPGGDDGVLQVQHGRRATATFAPKPAVDAKMRSVLGTALVATKEGLAFRVKTPNGPSRVSLWIGETGAANSRQFDLTVEGIPLPAVGMLPAGGWEKLGPIDVNLVDGHIDVAATAIKGIPQVMGILVEQSATVRAPNLVPNPGFEQGTDPWAYHGAARVNTGTHAGGFAGQVTGANVGIAQVLNGLQPNATYTLTAWGRIGAVEDAAYIYVKKHGGEMRTSAFTSTAGYMQSSLTFTTGATNTSAEFGVWKDTGGGSAWVDEFSLTISEGAP